MILAVLVGLAVTGFVVVAGVLLHVVDHRARVDGYWDGYTDAMCKLEGHRKSVVPAAKTLDSSLN